VLSINSSDFAPDMHALRDMLGREANSLLVVGTGLTSCFLAGGNLFAVYSVNKRHSLGTFRLLF
jgi:hypothetical protein